MARRPPRQRRSINWSAITSFITAATAVGALIFTAESLSATREQLEAARDQVKVAQQGQFTERYSRAIEQLGQQGPTQLQIRLGGIYALERLARDSPTDQPTIIEVLSTFIRTTTPTRHPEKGCPTTTLPTPDVHAALAVLGRRVINQDGGARIDLRATCLFGADLRGANLYRADLTRADLRSANLYRADLTRADLYGADLRDAGFMYADLSDAWLGGADLRSTHFWQAILTGADLSGADLSGADLSGASFTYADLSGADLTGAIHDNNTNVDGAVTDQDTRGMW